MSEPAPVTEASVLACEIAAAIGFSFADAADPADSDHLNADGAWEYQFESDPAWGFVAAGPGEPIETTYDGSPYGKWGKLTVQPFHWCVFCEDAPVAVFSPTDGTVGGPDALEAAMLDALRTEIDALTGGEER